MPRPLHLKLDPEQPSDVLARGLIDLFQGPRQGLGASPATSRPTTEKIAERQVNIKPV